MEERLITWVGLYGQMTELGDSVQSSNVKDNLLARSYSKGRSAAACDTAKQPQPNRAAWFKDTSASSIPDLPQPA